MSALHPPTKTSPMPRCRKATTLLGMGAALGLALTVPAPASAVTLADNLGETTNGGVFVDYDNASQANWQGMKFNTTSASIINSVTVKLGNASNTNTGSVAFDIYTSDGGTGLPGTSVASVGSILASNIASADANYTFGSLALALNPNSTYFLMARPVGFTSGTGITWRYTTNTNGFGYTPPVRARSSNNGSSFVLPGNAEYLQLKIEATTAPGPLPLLGGAAAFGWSRRMRQRLRTARKAANRCSHGA